MYERVNQAIKAQFDDFDTQFDKQISIIEEKNTSESLKSIARKKLTIIQEERNLWADQRQNGKMLASCVISNIDSVVQKAIA